MTVGFLVALGDIVQSFAHEVGGSDESGRLAALESAIAIVQQRIERSEHD